MLTVYARLIGNHLMHAYMYSTMYAHSLKI